MLTRSRAVRDPEYFWRSLLYFNVYRLTVATLLLVAVAVFGQQLAFGGADSRLFAWVSICYVLGALLMFVLVNSRAPEFDVQLSLAVGVDIVSIVLLQYASGGVASGLGILLLPSLAAAGLIARGRLTLFHAALASIAMLLEQTWQVLDHSGSVGNYAQAGMLSIAYFATAWLAHALARYATASEALAAQREIDVENISEVNRRVIQEMHDGVLVVDDAGLVRSWNSQAEQLLGAPPDDAEVRLSAWSPDLSARLARWQRDEPEGFDPLRTELSHKLVSARFVAIGRRARIGALVFVEDLTRVQQQAQQMKLASLGRLTANIAHEIRNPLSAISHATELLLEEEEDDGGVDATQKRLLQIIHDNTQRLNRMVQDVLKLNRRDRALREAVDVGDYLRTFVAQFAEIEHVDAEIFALDLAPGVIVGFDRSHLNQVMWNLCRNALRHCSRGAAAIRITVRPAELVDAVELHVVDDGPGIAPELRGQLFEPFFTTEASGTGLGLHIARELCAANAATLSYVDTPTGAHFAIVCRSG